MSGPLRGRPAATCFKNAPGNLQPLACASGHSSVASAQNNGRSRVDRTGRVVGHSGPSRPSGDHQPATSAFEKRKAYFRPIALSRRSFNSTRVTADPRDGPRRVPRAAAGGHRVPSRNRSSFPPSIARWRGRSGRALRGRARPPCPGHGHRGGLLEERRQGFAQGLLHHHTVTIGGNHALQLATDRTPRAGRAGRRRGSSFRSTRPQDGCG